MSQTTSLPPPKVVSGYAASPIVTCATALRALAIDVQTLHQALRDTRRQISRVDTPLKDTLRTEWTAYVDRYRNIVNDSNVAASKLSAMIDVYLALQGNTDEVAESDMATELSTLLTQLECYKFDPSNLCAKLKDDIEASLNHTGDEGYTGSPQLTDAGDHAQVDVLTAQSPRQVTSSFFAMLSRCLWSMWSFVSYRLSALSPPATEQRLTNGRVLTHTEATAVRRFKHMGERREVVAVRAAQSSDAACKMTVEGLIKSMRDHTRVLEAQVSKFNVFFEIAQHLKNEVGAYLLAFEAVKTYPTPEKRRALSNMHARVASSSASWKECATALKDGYSRVQK